MGSHLFLALALAAAHARLQRQHRGEHVVRVVLVAGDVRVLVKAEDLGGVGRGWGGGRGWGMRGDEEHEDEGEGEGYDGREDDE
jgi:hypothetical protein